MMAEKSTLDKASKMNAKQREILQVQRSLLSRNIVWTPVLAANLKAHHLLTDAMIAQIDAADGPETKILVMLDLLPLRTSQVYDKFADVLHMSGHTLLADFLREEDKSKQPLDVKDLFKRLPFLTKNMKDAEKRQIEHYMAEKIQSAILAHTWQWSTKDKDKALMAKQEQIEQAHVHEQEMRKKQEQVLEAQKLAKEAKEESLAAKAELRVFTENSQRQQTQMKGQLDTQMRFSLANDNIASRTNQRLQVAEQTLQSIQEKLQTVVRLSPRDQERELMKMADNPFFFLPDDVDLFITQFKKLLVIKLKYDDLCEERNYILTHLGLPQDKTEKEEEDDQQASLLKAYKDFSSKNDEQLQSLKKEVERYGDMLEDLSKTKEEKERKLAMAGTVWQNAIMSVMRKQLQDIKASIRKKDTTLGIKEAEITKLRNKISDLEDSLTSKTQEADLMARAVNIELQNGNGTTSADSIDGPAHPPPASPKPRTNTTALPPLRSSLSHKTNSSPRPGVSRAPHPHIAVPRGIVVESDTPLTMYPAGLSTMQLRVQREDTMKQAPPLPTDPRAKPQMGSSLGDLRAMHAHTKYPASRGVPGVGLDSSAQVNKQLTSPAPRRKMPARVK